MYKIAKTVNISLYYNVPVVLECFQSLHSNNVHHHPNLLNHLSLDHTFILNHYHNLNLHHCPTPTTVHTPTTHDWTTRIPYSGVARHAETNFGRKPHYNKRTHTKSDRASTAQKIEQE